jgi:hypothetical protein
MEKGSLGPRSLHLLLVSHVDLESLCRSSMLTEYERVLALAEMIKSLDSKAPDVCFIVVGSLYERLDSTSFFARQATSNELGELLDFIRSETMRWISAPRTTIQLESIKNGICECSLPHDYYHHLYHQTGWQESPFSYFWLNAWNTISSFDRELPTAQVRVDKFAKRRAWPKSMAHLLPHGPEDTIRGITNWFNIDLGPIEPRPMLQSLHFILRMTHSHTLPHVLTSRGFFDGPSGLFRLLSRPSNAFDSPEKFGSDKAQMIYALGTSILTACVALLTDVAVTWSTAIQRRTFLTSQVSSLVVYAEQAWVRAWISTKASPDFESLQQMRLEVNKFTTFATRLVSEFPESKTALMWPPFKAELDRLGAEECSPWMELMQRLVCLQQDDSCASPECRRVDVTSLRDLAYCGGCRLVLYCSRLCQKTAWTHPQVPHREVCQEF